MEKYISVDEFINITNGKEYDIDHAYGVQCVAGIKEFNILVYDKADFTCGNNWAYGLWTCYGSNGVEKYFDKYPYSEARRGDWIIWNKGSKECPNSHVSMFIERDDNGKVNAYGQSQRGIKAFNIASISEDGILGVLRPKIYLNKDFLPPRGYFTEGDSGENVSKIDDFYMAKVKGNYFGTYTKFLTMALQEKYNIQGGVDGNIGPYTLGKMKELGLSNSVNLPSRGYFTEGDSGSDIELIDNFLSTQVYGNYYGIFTKYGTKALQTIGKADGVYNDAIDGNFGPKTLATAEYYGFNY